MNNIIENIKELLPRTREEARRDIKILLSTLIIIIAFCVLDIKSFILISILMQFNLLYTL